MQACSIISLTKTCVTSRLESGNLFAYGHANQLDENDQRHRWGLESLRAETNGCRIHPLDNDLHGCVQRLLAFCPEAGARLAQSVERKALNLVAVGLSPTVGVVPIGNVGSAMSFHHGRAATNES